MTNASSIPESLEFSNGTTLFSVGWSYRNDRGLRLATGTFIEQYNNVVYVVRQSDDGKELEEYGWFDHRYPTTKVGWIPDVEGNHPDLIGTTGDFLRLWRVRDDEALTINNPNSEMNKRYSNTSGGSGNYTKSSSSNPANSNNPQQQQPANLNNTIELNCTLNNDVESKCCAPLTAFDWNQVDPSLIGTSSIDTTCTIWDIAVQKRRTQLIAHDKAVYDFAFAGGSVDVFASVGADGSVRLFDLRALDHSTIIYESRENRPLLRLRWNTCAPNILATVGMDDPMVELLDIRQPSRPVVELDHRSASAQNCVNALSWAPHNKSLITTGSDRCLALIWNVEEFHRKLWNVEEFHRKLDPLSSYAADASITNMQWGPTNPDWIALVVEDKLRVLRA